MKNKKIFGIFAVIFLGLVLIASPFLFSKQVKDVASADYDSQYNSPISINSVHLDVVVAQDGVLTINEKFEVTFLQPGLSEVLFFVPYKGVIYREDELGKVTKTNYIAKISNYSLIKEQSGSEVLKFYPDESSGYVTFGIKNESGYYSKNDTRTYTITYNYDMGNKGTSDYDEVYFNLLGYNSAMPVNNVTFKITFPSEIDFASYTPAFYYGEAGSVTEFTDFSVLNGNTIISNSPLDLKEYESLTLRQLLPKGYLKVASPNTLMPILALIISIALSVVIILLKFKYRQNGEVVSPVEFTAPEGISPDVAEFYYKDKVTNKSAGALIIYLANKGYISVITSEDEKHEAQTLKKLKDLPEDANNNIKRVFDAMFADGDTISIDALNNVKFYSVFNSLQLNVTTNHGERMFEQKSKKGLNTANLLPIISLLLNFVFLLLASVIRVGFVANFVYVSILTTFIGIMLAVFCRNGMNKWLSILVFVIISACSIIINIVSLHLLDPYYLLAIANIIALVPVLFAFKPKYTEKAAKIRGSVLGLRNYINLAEKDRLEMLTKDNPNYYFDILPYAYVLDVSDVWMEKFKDIKIPAPAWIESTTNVDLLDVIIISSIINNLNLRVGNSIFAQATQASASKFKSVGRSIGRIGGGFSGGGFSGGGGGGGSFGAR